MNVTQWFPAIVAIATMIANAAMTYAAVARHEKAIARLDELVQELRTDIAVIKATRGGEGA